MDRPRTVESDGAPPCLGRTLTVPTEVTTDRAERIRSRTSCLPAEGRRAGKERRVTGPPREQDMNAVFARAALAMHGEAAADFQWVCQTVVTVAQQFVPGADHTLLMLRNRHGSSRVAAASDALAVRIGTLHHHYTEGPCVQSARTGHSVTVTDLARECRWSHFTHAALAETPIRAVLAVPVETVHHRIGVLGMCATGAATGSEATGSEETGSEETERVGRIWATHAAIALSTARREEQFRRALASRDTIGQAKGMVMQRHRIDADRAFQMISALSQNTNIPVADVAARITETGADAIPPAAAAGTTSWSTR